MKIFLDTSILIEYIKGNKTKLLEAILSQEWEPSINHIVYSEFMFHFVSIASGKAPLTLKKSTLITQILDKNNPIDFILNFSILSMNSEILLSSYLFMKKYHLLPNDALILSTCQHYNIKFLASYDMDFEVICKQEGITLVMNVNNLES